MQGKEYVAVKQDNPGVLVLSEMAGAAVELTDALLVTLRSRDHWFHQLPYR